MLLQRATAIIIALFCFGASISSYAVEYKTIEWTDLIPKEDLEALKNPPEWIQNIPDGSEEDNISNMITNLIGKASDSRYQQALSSTEVKKEYDKQSIRIPGFIVPLEFDDTQLITEFFLVPYFGACIHVPPPPPNQMIHAIYKKGIRVDALYTPFWLNGTLHTKILKNEVGTSAYSMKVTKIELYEE